MLYKNYAIWYNLIMKTKFAERLKEMRLERKMTQQELSLHTKFSQSAIARWEMGEQIPNVEVLTALAVFFNVSTDFLVGLKDS